MTVTHKEIRAWGVTNGYKCRTGKLGQGIVDAYQAAHPDDVIDVPAPAPDPAPEPVIVDETPDFTVSVTIAGHEEAAATIAQHLVEALWGAFQGGRAAERRDMLTQLGGTA